MNCVELQQSLAEAEDASSVEQSAHLRACPACSALVKRIESDRRGGGPAARGGRTQSQGLEFH